MRHTPTSVGLPTNTAPSDASPKTVPFRYYNVIRNCGDAVTSYILEDSFGLTGRVSSAREEHLLGIGSIFFMANRNSHIWGSGVLTPQAPIPEINPARIHALRGKRTVAHLRSLGHQIPDVPLGDAGILAASLVTPSTAPKYRAAIVPHHSGFNSKKWQAASGDGICIVDMMDDTLLPVQQIADAEVVISQSLHGLIFAAALGKPYLWISGQSSGTWNFKFLDWFSTCDNPQDEPVLLNVSIEEMIRMAEPRGCLASKDDLRAAFPTHLIDDAPKAQGDFHANRVLSPAHVFVAGPPEETLTPQQLAERVMRIRDKTFAGSPEPTYLAVSQLGGSHTPTRHDLLRGQRYLDENRNAAFLWFGGDSAEHRSFNFELSGVSFGEASLQGGTVLVRPDGQMGRNQRFAIAAAKTPLS